MNSKTLILLSCMTAFCAASCVSETAAPSVSAAPPKASASPKTSVSAEAAKLIAAKKYDEALKMARNLLTKSPDEGLALSLELLKNPEFKQAEQLYGQVVHYFCNIRKDRDAFLKFNAELLSANAPCKYAVLAQNVAVYLYKKDNAKANELEKNIFEDVQVPASVRARHFIAWGNRNYPQRFRKSRAEGITKAESLLAIKNLSGRDYANLATFIATQYKWMDDEKNQEKYLRLILARKDVPVSFRVKASKALAVNCMNRKDVAGAEKLLTEFLSYPDVKWNEVFDDGYRILAKFYIWTGRFDQAMKLMDDFEAKYKVKQTRARAELYAMALRFDDAVKVCQEANDYSYGDRYNVSGEKRHDYWLKVLEDPTKKGARKEAFLVLFNGNDEEMKIAEKYMDELFFKDVKDVSKINLPNFHRAVWGNVHLANFGKLDKQLNMVFRFPAANQNYFFVQTRIVTWYALGKKKEAAAFAERAKNTPEFTTQQKMILSILAKADSKNFASELEKILKAFPVSKSFPAEKRAEGLVLAGRMVLFSKLDDSAKILDQAHKKLYAPEPRKVFDLAFSSKPIYGLSDFLAVKSNMKPQLMDRKFGGNMDFLVTDVSTGNRGENIGSQQDKKIQYNEFYALCDARGLHMVFKVPTDDPDAMMDKLISAGSFEMYLAPGENQPYTCFLTDANDTSMSPWNTIYNTQQHHRISKNSSNFITEARAGDKCVWKYMFLSWKNYPVQLPEDGECWEFENVHWSAAGGYGWNGTKSIHGRSTWGLLRFHLTKAQRTAIKRGLIFEAARSYEKEKISRGWSGNGILAYWQDKELGDPAFYQECLKPVVERLDSYLPLLKADMTDADVNKVYDEALPGWLNLRFTAAELRTKYLARQLVKE